MSLTTAQTHNLLVQSQRSKGWHMGWQFIRLGSRIHLKKYYEEWWQIGCDRRKSPVEAEEAFSFFFFSLQDCLDWSMVCFMSTILSSPSTIWTKEEQSGGTVHCCRLQAVYSRVTVKNFVTIYTGFNPCNRGNLLLRL